MLVYAARLGVLFGKSRPFGSSELGSHFEFGSALGLRLANDKLLIGPELFGSTVFLNGALLSQRATPVEALLGAHYSLTESWMVGVAVSGGVTACFGAPLLRGLASVDWAPSLVPAPPPVVDSDGDGIRDPDDACPQAPGPASNDRLTRGCPPSDRDHDGVLDSVDACPDLAGVESGDPKTNGCKPIARVCPAIPAASSDDPSAQGCPTDRDRDGVVDELDACPDVPGEKTADPRTSGCPGDGDKDGVLDPEDACPAAAGPARAERERSGCPDAFVKGDQIVIVEQVKFKTASAILLDDKENERVLQAVLGVLKQHPEIARVRIEGHTDDRGPAELNRDLSRRRALAVANWLTWHGVAGTKLSSVGMGADRPLSSNETEEGRKNNRRVEFHIDGAQAGGGTSNTP